MVFAFVVSILIYLDTNVIMDLFLYRNSSSDRLLAKALKCKYFIIISDFTVHELSRYRLLPELMQFLTIYQAAKKIKVCKISDENKKEATLLLHKTHYADALHKVVACHNGAKMIVTRNLKDFPFTDIVVISPDTL